MPHVWCSQHSWQWFLRGFPKGNRQEGKGSQGSSPALISELLIFILMGSNTLSLIFLFFFQLESKCSSWLFILFATFLEAISLLLCVPSFPFPTIPIWGWYFPSSVGAVVIKEEKSLHRNPAQQAELYPFQWEAWSSASNPSMSWRLGGDPVLILHMILKCGFPRGQNNT